MMHITVQVLDDTNQQVRSICQRYGWDQDQIIRNARSALATLEFRNYQLLRDNRALEMHVGGLGGRIDNLLCLVEHLRGQLGRSSQEDARFGAH